MAKQKHVIESVDVERSIIIRCAAANLSTQTAWAIIILMSRRRCSLWVCRDACLCGCLYSQLKCPLYKHVPDGRGVCASACVTMPIDQPVKCICTSVVVPQRTRGRQRCDRPHAHHLLLRSCATTADTSASSGLGIVF